MGQAHGSHALTGSAMNPIATMRHPPRACWETHAKPCTFLAVARHLFYVVHMQPCHLMPWHAIPEAETRRTHGCRGSKCPKRGEGIPGRTPRARWWRGGMARHGMVGLSAVISGGGAWHGVSAVGEANDRTHQDSTMNRYFVITNRNAFLILNW